MNWGVVRGELFCYCSERVWLQRKVGVMTNLEATLKDNDNPVGEKWGL